MISFNSSTVLPNDTPMTFQELIRAAILARTYPTTTQRDEAASRIEGCINQGFIRVSDTIYLIDAYKGVKNGVVVADDWTTPDDFTDAPGGGEPVESDIRRHFDHPVDIGNRVAYQNSSGDVTVYFDVTII